MPRRIALTIHSLAGGGAERIAALMASHWAQRGDEVTLITLDSADHDAYPLADQVRRIGLSLLRPSSHPLAALWHNLNRLISLRRAIRRCQPDHVVSLVDKMNILTLFACAGLRLDVVICERVHPRRYRIGPVWSLLRRISYRWCRALTVQTAETATFARRLVGRKQPIHVVPNPVLLEQEATSPGALGHSPDGKTVIAAGRFVEQKGFDMLLAAFAQIAPRHPDWQLKILGDGPLRDELSRLIDRLHLRGRAQLPGWIAPPYDQLRQSDLYVLSSRFEGFPMVLLEAMACGLPVIAFDCESGPREIVRDGIDGRLIPPDQVVLLAEAMDQLMSDDNLRRQFALRAQEVRQRFSQQAFFERWDEILADARKG